MGGFADVTAIARATLTQGPDAAALYHLGWAQIENGQLREALASTRQALDLGRRAGDRSNEAVTRYDIASLNRHAGDLDRAIAELEIVVELDRQVGHPDLAADTAMLDQLRREWAGAGPGS